MKTHLELKKAPKGLSQNVTKHYSLAWRTSVASLHGENQALLITCTIQHHPKQ